MTVDLARLRAAHARARVASPYAEDVEEYADLVATYLPALLNDLETLRARVAEAETAARDHHLYPCETCILNATLAADREREAIVAMLRCDSPGDRYLHGRDLAARIERGDHHATEPTKPIEEITMIYPQHPSPMETLISSGLNTSAAQDAFKASLRDDEIRDLRVQRDALCSALIDLTKRGVTEQDCLPLGRTNLPRLQAALLAACAAYMASHNHTAGDPDAD